MTPLRRRLLEDLPPRGLAPKTHQCDVAAVRQRAPHSRRPPDQRSEAALRPSLLSLLHDQKVAERAFRLHLYGIWFVSERTLQRLWLLCALTRPRHSPQLPVVWSPLPRPLLHQLQRWLARHAPTIARMCFPSGTACLKMPSGLEPRVRATTLLCRLRATKTFIR
jgi:hypothetical protein